MTANHPPLIVLKLFGFLALIDFILMCVLVKEAANLVVSLLPSGPPKQRLWSSSNPVFRLYFILDVGFMSYSAWTSSKPRVLLMLYLHWHIKISVSRIYLIVYLQFM